MPDTVDCTIPCMSVRAVSRRTGILRTRLAITCPASSGLARRGSSKCLQSFELAPPAGCAEHACLRVRLQLLNQPWCQERGNALPEVAIGLMARSADRRAGGQVSAVECVRVLAFDLEDP
jgi:hypothetical protein